MNDSKSNAGTWIIGLIVVSLLGYIAYQVSINETTPQQSDDLTQQQATTTEAEVGLSPDLPEGISEAMNAPSEITSTTRSEYENLLSQHAVTKNRIQVDENCQTSDPIVRVESGEDFIVKNDSSSELVFNLNRESYNVQPGGNFIWVAGSGTRGGVGYFGLICRQANQEDAENWKTAQVWVVESVSE